MEAMIKEECSSTDTSLASFPDALDEMIFCISPTAKSDDGMVTPSLSSSRKILCQVCGALSSGLHFGVFTCEGCKCFYRRSIKEGANYACAKDRNCDITMETRNSCRFCRFQKCLALGMSKEGIKLGRRPKVDSDVFQQGFYHPGDMEMLHSHTPQTYSWPGTDHIGTHYPTAFKSEPAFMDVNTRGKEAYRESSNSAVNYSMKREAYTTCDQHNGLHYPHQGSYLMPTQLSDVSPSIHSPGSHRDHYEGVYSSTSEPSIHPQQHVYHPPDTHPHHTTPTSNPVPIMHTPVHPPAHPIATQSRMEQEGSGRSWSAELSPTSSMSSGSEDTWEGNVYKGNLPSSVTLTLPEVHSGAVAAMAYANLYRGKNESQLSPLSSLPASELSTEDKSPMKKTPELSFSPLSDLERGSRSYTELVPRKSTLKTDSLMQTVRDRQGAIGYANKLHTDQSDSMALSPKPALPACSSSNNNNNNNNNNNESWVGHPDVRPPPPMRQGESPTLTMDHAHSEGHLKMKSADREEMVRDGQGNVRLLNDIISLFLDLKMNILMQWKVYQSKVSIKEKPGICLSEVESFVNSTHTITEHIRNYVHKVLGLVQQTCTSGLELVWTSLAVVVRTCLLLDMSNNDHLKTRDGHHSPYLRTEEAACISILAIFSSAGLSGASDMVADSCQWICQAAQTYLKENCETEEKFQEVVQLLRGESSFTPLASPT